jgi:integrase
VYSNAEVRSIFAAVGEGAFADLVGLLFHCGTRDEETRSMRWADVDLDERHAMTIPSNVSKNDQPHVVALSSGAGVLQRIRDRVSKLSPFVFPANTKRLHGSPARRVPRRVDQGGAAAERRHRESRDTGDRLRLRHSENGGRSRETGARRGAAARALGHGETMLTRTYGPTPALKQQAAAVEWWSDELAKILAAKDEQSKAAR